MWDDQYVQILSEIERNGVRATPSMGSTKELIAHTFTLEDPRDRIAFNPARALNIFQTLGHWLWMLSGRSDYGFIHYYNPSGANRFSVDYRQIEGAYGPRIFGTGGYRQIPRCIELLRTKSSTRRAVATVYAPALDFHRDSSEDGKRIGETPCTLSFQFLKREGKLHCITTMRSQDALMLLPQDVFHFSLFHEFVAASTETELGDYHHQAGSIHVYDRAQARLQSVLAAPAETRVKMPAMTLEDQMPHLRKVLDLEERIRVNALHLEKRRMPKPIDIEVYLRGAKELPEFWQTVVHALIGWAMFKTGDLDHLKKFMKTAHPYMEMFLRRALALGSPDQMLDNYMLSGEVSPSQEL